MIKQIENYLKQNSISVPIEWIEACINFIKSEHGSSNVQNYNWLQDKVREQWLHADLTELGTCCLPFNLGREKLKIINGTYALQINHMKDIGLPAYSQLQKLRKDDVENTSVSAEKNFTAAWEPKPSRMLLLQLTDGTTVVQGMEYKPINSLSLSMKPGVKILLKGDIETRRGVLLLTSNNVTVLGGEVESLILANAPENVMRRTLGLEESDSPIPVPESFVPIATQENATQSQYYNTQRSQVNPFSNTFNRTNKIPQSQSFNDIPSSVVASQQFDDDLDFIDMETEKAILEAEQKASSALGGKNQTNSLTQNCGAGLERYVNSTNNNSFINLKPSSSLGICSKKTSVFFNSTNKNLLNSNSHPQFIKDTFDSDMDFDDNDDLLLAAAEVENFESSTQCSSNNFMQTSSKYNNNNKNNYNNRQKNVSQSKFQIKAESNKNTKGSLGSCFSSANQLSQTNSAQSSGLKNLSGSKKTFVYGSEKSRQTSLSDFKFEKKIKEEKIVNLVSPSKDMKSVLRTKPYQYICNLNLLPKEKIVYTVKGFFTTLLSKIEQNNGKWNIAAKINDGTGSCDVDIDDSVLRDLIDMSVEEFKVQKQLALKDVQLRSTLAQRVIRCQMELIRACCILQLEVCPSSSRPKVTKLIPLSDIHLKQLKERAT